MNIGYTMSCLESKESFRSWLVILLAGIGMGIGTSIAWIMQHPYNLSIITKTDFLLFAGILIITLGIVCLLPSLYQIWKNGLGNANVFSPITLFPLLYFAVYGLGTLKLVFAEETCALNVLCCALAGIGFYYLGLFCAPHYRERGPVQRHHSCEWDPYLFFLIMGSFIAISLIALAYHGIRAGLPIFIPDIEIKRISIQQYVTGYIYFLIRLITPAFLFLLTYGLLYRRIRRTTLIYLFALGLFMLLTLANRHEIFTFAMSSLIIYGLIARNVRGAAALSLLIIGLTILMGIGFYRMLSLSQGSGLKDSLESVAGLNPVSMFLAYSLYQFSVYPSNFAIYLETFPHVLPFELGYSLVRALSTVLPGHQDLLEEVVKAELNMDFPGGGINATILGELYANFGYWGLMAMSCYGGVISLLYNKMTQGKKGINYIAYAFGLTSLLLSISLGFFSHFLPFYYITVIAVANFLVKRGDRDEFSN
jgi:oligosaccharide repeat unit polymerase